MITVYSFRNCLPAELVLVAVTTRDGFSKSQLSISIGDHNVQTGGESVNLS